MLTDFGGQEFGRDKPETPCLALQCLMPQLQHLKATGCYHLKAPSFICLAVEAGYQLGASFAPHNLVAGFKGEHPKGDSIRQKPYFFLQSSLGSQAFCRILFIEAVMEPVLSLPWVSAEEK